MPDTTFVMRMRSPAVTVVRAHPRRCATLVPAVQTTREPPARGVCTARSRVAQSAERPAVNRQVVGSIPTAGARRDHLPAISSADLQKRRLDAASPCLIRGQPTPGLDSLDLTST